ncbi:MAG: extracellular solute-binding protein [Lachnospiraceae bacterium]|nr:extracellular solute-binding protein [Lachnospiraceae bacterium]
MFNFKNVCYKAFAICLTGAVALSSTGCKIGFGGKKKGNSNIKVENGGAFKIDEEVGDGIAMVVEDSTVAYANGYFLFDVYSTDDATAGNTLYVYNVEDDELNSYEVPDYYERFQPTKDGNVYAVNYDYTKNNPPIELISLDSKGEVKQKVESKDFFKEKKNNNISDLRVDGDGNCYVLGDSEIVKLNDKFKRESSIKFKDSVDGIGFDNDDNLICSMYDPEEGTSSVYECDFKKGEIGESVAEFDGYGWYASTISKGFDDYVFTMACENGIYGFKEDGSNEILLHFLNSNIDSSGNNLIKVIDKENSIAVLNNGSEEEPLNQICKLVKIPDKEFAKKEVITFGSPNIDYSVKTSIVEFNKQSDKYRVEIVDYEGDNPIDTFKTEITAGNIPDIIDTSALSSKSLVSKNLLEDLTPYFDKDKDVKKDDILDAVIRACSIDDKIYTVSPGFNISSLVTSTDRTDADHWTYDEFLDMVDGLKKDEVAYNYNTKFTYFNAFVLNNVDEFIDFEKGKCNFDSETFKRLLEFCNSGSQDVAGGEENDDGNDKIVKKRFKNDLYLSIGFQGNPSYICLYDQMFKGKANYIGYPSDKCSGTYMMLSSSFSMYSKSAVKDGAWELLKYFLSREYQGKSLDSYLIPTRKDNFEDYCKQFTTTEKYTDEWGHKVVPASGMDSAAMFEGEIKPLTEDQIDIFRDLVDKSTLATISFYNDKLSTILSEELEAYYNGDKSVDNVCDSIQNRVTTYINESK